MEKMAKEVRAQLQGEAAERESCVADGAFFYLLMFAAAPAK
jgi:hypothetical protein